MKVHKTTAWLRGLDKDIHQAWETVCWHGLQHTCNSYECAAVWWQDS
jgi:hypothetical protein